MKIRSESVAARQDGYVMINDGKPENENEVYSAVRKIIKQNPVKAILEPAIESVLTLNVPVEYQIPQPVRCFPQKILCYDRLKLI